MKLKHIPYVNLVISKPYYIKTAKFHGIIFLTHKAAGHGGGESFYYLKGIILEQYYNVIEKKDNWRIQIHINVLEDIIFRTITLNKNLKQVYKFLRG